MRANSTLTATRSIKVGRGCSSRRFQEVCLRARSSVSSSSCSLSSQDCHQRTSRQIPMRPRIPNSNKAPLGRSIDSRRSHSQLLSRPSFSGLKVPFELPGAHVQASRHSFGLRNSDLQPTFVQIQIPSHPVPVATTVWLQLWNLEWLKGIVKDCVPGHLNAS